MKELLLVPLVLAIASPAWAQSESSTTAATISGKDPNRSELGLLPAVNYNSDLGFGFGILGALAQFEPGCEPYAWRVQALLYATAKDSGGGVEIPYQSHYVKIDIPQFVEPKLRLNTVARFRKFSNAGYFGFGSNTQRREFSDNQLQNSLEARQYHTYDRIYPSLDFNLRYQIYDEPQKVGKWRLEFFGGLNFSYNVFTYYDGSLLQSDLQLARLNTPDGLLMRDLLQGTNDHLLGLINLGLIWDTRDHEYIPTRGTFTELSMAFSPGFMEDLLYTSFNLQSSWFFGLWEDYIVLAGRLIGNILVGKPPFYIQSQYGVFDPTEGPGGGWSLRSVLINRYAGKAKLIGNLELRTRTKSFGFLGQRLSLGLVGFADAGRVWADFENQSLRGVNLDGDFSDFSVGLGGGLRVQWGETFIIRADYGYSPTDSTSGLYIDVGHVF